MRKIKHEHSRKARRKLGQKFIPPGLGKPLLYLLLAVTAPILLRLGAHEFIHKRKFPLQTAEWKVYSPGLSRLSLLLPGEPQPESFQATASGPAIRQVDRYQVSVKEFRVLMWDVSYQEGAPADLNQAAHDLLASALKELGQVTEYQETVTPTKRSGRSGMLINGTFKRKGEPRQFRALLLGEGPRLWQVVVIHPASDDVATTASRSIIDSIRII